MRTLFTHCALRLGDNLAHLHFLRKLAEANREVRFVHFAHETYLPQLYEVVADQGRISLVPFPPLAFATWWTAEPDHRYKSLNAWKNADGFWERHPERLVYSTFMLDWFRTLAGRIQLTSPLETPHDLLFDYPALYLAIERCGNPRFLIINSAPMSGQAGRCSLQQLGDLAEDLVKTHGEGSVICTSASHLPAGHGCLLTSADTSVTHIGRWSQSVEAVIMISTGPSWPTFNIWNHGSLPLRIVINEPELVDLDPRAIHCQTAAQVREALKKADFL